MAKKHSTGFTLHEFTTPKTGKRKFRARVKRAGVDLNRAFHTKAEAETWARDLVERIDSGEFSRTSDVRAMTVRQAILDFCNESDEAKLPRRYRWWIDQLGTRKLIDVKHADIKAALLRLEKTAKVHGGHKPKPTKDRLSPASINRYRNALSAVFRDYVADGGLSKNPCRGAGLKREENNLRRRWLDEAEAARLVEACRESDWDRLALLVLIALCSGGRRNEILFVQWKDVRWGDNYAEIHVGTTKTGEPKMLQVVGEAFTELQKWSKVRRLDNPFVFPSPKMNGMPARNYRPHFSAALEKAGIEDFRFHDLRHTTASWLVQQGVSDYHITQILGWSSPAMMKRYAHLRTEDHRNALRRVFENER